MRIRGGVKRCVMRCLNRMSFILRVPWRRGITCWFMFVSEDELVNRVERAHEADARSQGEREDFDMQSTPGPLPPQGANIMPNRDASYLLDCLAAGCPEKFSRYCFFFNTRRDVNTHILCFRSREDGLAHFINVHAADVKRSRIVKGKGRQVCY